MKEYESREGQRRLMPLLPVMARLDGKCFSSFTKGLNRPYDLRMSNALQVTCQELVKKTDALVGYTQSDEISLLWEQSSYHSEMLFGGRIQKLCSVLASMTTAKFMHVLSQTLPEYVEKLPVFDCRIWQVPNRIEAANTFLWREKDATKNSISMAAREHYSHKNLYKKSADDMQEMLWQQGVNWNDFPAFFKRGTFFIRQKTVRSFTQEELAKLPPKHLARTHPFLTVERSDIRETQMPPFTKVINRVAVLFEGDEPETADILLG